jgi:ribose 1,5-bisphosphate isomerase
MFPREFREIVDGIRLMKIRGAGLIARKAVEALTMASQSLETGDAVEYMDSLREAARLLVETRPTAVSLPNAVRYILYRARRVFDAGQSVDEIRKTVESSAEEFIETSLNAVKRIGEIGAGRIEDGDVVLTHCNSQAVNSIIKQANDEGKDLKVYVTESRPRYQGRITATQLSEMGIPVTLIVDTAARYYMLKMDKVIVGADAVASNGAVVNKIGTATIALAANEARVRMMVAAETYKFSPETFLGELVEIEERPVEEVVSYKWLSQRPHVKVLNPSFDITPPEYIDLIITEIGVVSPYSILFLIKERFGWSFEEEPWKSENSRKV